MVSRYDFGCLWKFRMWLYEKKIKTSTKKLAEHFWVHLCNANLKLIIYQCFSSHGHFCANFRIYKTNGLTFHLGSRLTLPFFLKWISWNGYSVKGGSRMSSSYCVFGAVCTECLPFLGGECCCYVNSSIVYCTFYSCKYIVCLFLIILSSKYLPSR